MIRQPVATHVSTVRPLFPIVGLLLALLAVASCERGCQTAPAGQTPSSVAVSRLSPDPARIDSASAELRQRLRDSPHAFFRFLNKEWMQEVCGAFEGELKSVPAVRLHGDAHVEQYAVTGGARGLDDFDDSAVGPAVIDLVRFLGSLEMTAHQRGWSQERNVAADAFLRGYRRALQDPTYLPSDPSVVQRIRKTASRSQAEFLAWAESLMQPPSSEDVAALKAAWPRLEAYAREADPSVTPDYVRLKRAGWLRMGIGSALARKFLLRLEGPSPASDDDLVIEAKEVTTLRGVSCLTVPASGEVFRVVEGMSQLGRVSHRVLVVVPLFPISRPDARGWWVKNWEPSYQEVEIGDFASEQELAEVAHDVGAQLGSTSTLGSVELAPQKRLMELESVTHLEPRIREVAHDLSSATLEAWTQFRRR